MKRALLLTMVILMLITMTSCIMNPDSNGSILPAHQRLEHYAPFDGYTELTVNDKISSNEYSFHGTFQIYSYRSGMLYMDFSHGEPGVGISFYADNQGTAEVPLRDLISNINTHYLSEGTHYMYPMIFCSYNPTNFWYDSPFMPDSPSIGSLNKRFFGAYTTLIPSSAVNAVDGTLAITFTFLPTNTNYVVYLRRPAEQP